MIHGVELWSIPGGGGLGRPPFCGPTEEHENFIADAHFYPFSNMKTYGNQNWLNPPSGRHGNAGSITFADGRNGDTLRFLAVAPNGDLYANTRKGGIIAMRDADGDGRAGRALPFVADGSITPAPRRSIALIILPANWFRRAPARSTNATTPRRPSSTVTRKAPAAAVSATRP